MREEGGEEMKEKLTELKDKIDDKLTDPEFAGFSSGLALVISLISLTAVVLLVMASH